jgi:hypothetical protein
MVSLLLSALMASQPATANFVRRYIRGHLPQIRACYESELQRNPTLTTKVTLRLVFGPSGQLFHASADGVIGPMKDCILEAVYGWSLQNWQPELRSDLLVVTYPIALQPSPFVVERAKLRLDARACWEGAMLLGARGDVSARVTRHRETDGFEVVSVEETALPDAAALCLARAASRHMLGDAEQWFWFHTSDD